MTREGRSHSCTPSARSSTPQNWVCCLVPKDCETNRNFTDYIECIFEVACPDMVYDCPNGAIGKIMGAVSQVGYALGALSIVMAAAAGSML